MGRTVMRCTVAGGAGGDGADSPPSSPGAIHVAVLGDSNLADDVGTATRSRPRREMPRCLRFGPGSTRSARPATEKRQGYWWRIASASSSSRDGGAPGRPVVILTAESRAVSSLGGSYSSITGNGVL